MSENQDATTKDHTEEAAEEAGTEQLQGEVESGFIDESADGEQVLVEADLSAEVATLNEQLQEAKDQVLRTAAEMQNLRKRSERDVESAHKFGQEKLISSLLPVLDNLDRAIESITKETAKGANDDEQSAALTSITEGVELTRKSLTDALQRFSVEILEPYGEPFDPQFHQAMTMVPSETAEPNSVIDVLQKGYALNGRLLRPAMVVIAKSS